MPKYKRGLNDHICLRTTTRTPELEKDQRYEQLNTATLQAETAIIGGDIRGHVGMYGRESTSHGIIGVGERNKKQYGDRVVEFANTLT